MSHAPMIPHMTPEAFDAFIADERNEGIYELIGGRVNDKLDEANMSTAASAWAATLTMFIYQHVLDEKRGVVTGAGGGYRINAQYIVPDAAFIPIHPSELTDLAYHPQAPALAVEVEMHLTAPSVQRLIEKLYHYQQANVLVWVVYPETQTVMVHAPHQAPQRLEVTDTLDGGAVLPDFRLPLAQFFA